MEVRVMRAKFLMNILMAVLVAVVAIARPPQAKAGDEALMVYSAGLDGLLVDERDEVLKQALKLLDERVLELPRELDEPDMPAPILRTALEMLASPMWLKVGMLDPEQAEGSPMPVYGQLVVQAERLGDARDQATTLMRLLEMQAGDLEAIDVPDMTGMKLLDLDGVPGYLGATEIAGRPAFVAAINRVDSEPPQLQGFGLPDDVKPAFAMSFDAGAMQPLFQMMLQQVPDHEREMVAGIYEMSGLLGEHPMKLEMACGYGRDRGYGVFRYFNYTASELNTAMLVREPVKRKHVQMIPADATYAEVYRMDFSGIADVIRMFTADMPDMPEDGDVIEMIAQQTGINLENDILDYLGTSTGWYMADSTGGGGLLSMVGFVEVADEAGLNETMGKLALTVNQLGHQFAKGYVRITTREIEGRKITSLMFPGLPIPIELSWAISDGNLWCALSPQSIITAIKQAKGDGPSLADNPRFRELARGKLGDAIGFQFADTPRLAQRGYGLLNLGVAALSNAVRSPTDPDRDPGLTLPSYQELTKGAKGSLTIVRMDGEDMVMDMQFDRSMLVNLSAGVGMLGGSSSTLAVGALGAGIMMPAMARAREQAKVVKSSAQLRQIAQCGMIYGSEFDDRLPKSFDALVEHEYCQSDLFDSPLGEVWDADYDYWLDFSVERFAQVKFPARRIWGYDRAALASGSGKIPVLYFDGHVEMMEPWNFHSAVQNEFNKDVDFNLP
jgi:prepilin-type processing-associated H-X9-DG protein